MNLLITAQEVISLSFPDKNFLPGKILDTNIQVAQEALLRPALGDDFYESLIAQTPTGDNETLINEYLKRPLAMYVRYVILPEIMVHASNTGIQLVQPIGTVSASDKQAGTLREQARENANILMGLALRFIQSNIEKYPIYSFPDTVRSRSRIIGGVIFSRRNGTRSAQKSIGTTPILMTGVVKLVDDVRKITGHAYGDIVICAENNIMYEYNDQSVSQDDGYNYVKPYNVTTGRWVKSKELQMVNL